MKPVVAIYVFWVLWVLIWMAGALLAPSHLKNPHTPLTWLYRLLLLAGYGLLFGLYNRYDNQFRLWDALTGPLGWTMAAAVLAAFVLCLWARLQFGFQWTHEPEAGPAIRLVESGPYRFVRHPYYIGLVAAAAATAAVHGTPSAAAGVALLAATFLMKALAEEAGWRGETAAGPFEAYAGRVPMLVPLKFSWLWRGEEAPAPAPVMAPPVMAAPVAAPPLVEAPVIAAPPVATVEISAPPAEAKPGEGNLELFPAAPEAKPAPEKPRKAEKPAVAATEEEEDTLDLFAPAFKDEAAKDKADGSHPALSEAISITKR